MVSTLVFYKHLSPPWVLSKPHLVFRLAAWQQHYYRDSYFISLFCALQRKSRLWLWALQKIYFAENLADISSWPAGPSWICPIIKPTAVTMKLALLIGVNEQGLQAGLITSGPWVEKASGVWVLIGKTTRKRVYKGWQTMSNT